MGRVKASPASSVSGMRSGAGPGPMALNEMSTPPALSTTVVEVLLHGFLVKSVNLGCLSDAADSSDLLGDGIQLRHVASCQEKPCALACESPGDGAADRAPGGIDHGGLVLKQHVRPHWRVYRCQVHVRSDTGGGENGTAGPFRDEPVSSS